MSAPAFTDSDATLLLRLLATPTAGPLEAGEHDPPAELWRAGREYADAAARIGMTVVHHGAPDPRVLDRPDVPEAVRAAVAADPGFLAAQPSLVLRLGPSRGPDRTVMFNVHLDTVAGRPPVRFDGTAFHGRGAVDATGPAVALLAGIRAARAADPALGRDVSVLVQAVAGEEGGAMGTFGTRPLVEAGYTGRLNVFCEPTGLRYLPRATAAATARVRVRGEDAIDDRPAAGHNATVLLGFLAPWLAADLDGPDGPHGSGTGGADGSGTRGADGAGPGGVVCVAGLHTGDAHNRVYGSGRLLLNLSYASSAAGARLERRLPAALDRGLAAFTARFRGHATLHRTAVDARGITVLEWLKRGLPCLRENGPRAAGLLAAAGVPRWPDGEPAFTCDAIWMDGVPGAHTVVLGPGSLDRNHAHADGEFVERAELAAFAGQVRDVLLAFRGEEIP